MKYRMIIAYDGSEFSGWQIQPDACSIQGELERSLYQITHESVRILGAGRTDAGVHAYGQVAHFQLQHSYDLVRLLRGLNGVLPASIRVLRIEEVPLDFHAQRLAQKKEYHYCICLRPVLLPFERLYMWHCRRTLDLSLLSQATRYFIGKKDFAAFANARGHGNVPKTTERILYRLDVRETVYGLRLEFEGNGFLYKMVRNITSMLIAVAGGKRDIEDIPLLFASRDRRQGESVAPPHGLFLMNIRYPY